MELRHNSRIVTTVAVTAAVWLTVLYIFASPIQPNIFQAISRLRQSNKNGDVDSWCPLPDPIAPSRYRDGIDLPSSSHFAGEAWTLKQVERLSAAINISTESYDDNGDVDENPRWKPFDQFHRLLHNLFPKVYAVFKLLLSGSLVWGIRLLSAFQFRYC